MTFGMIIVIQFLVVVDASIVFIAMPSIAEDLGFSTTGLAWVIDAYTVAFAGFMLLGGRLADLYGRRRVLLAGILIFAAGSLGSGVAMTAEHLVAARAVQGFGAAIVSPAALALIVDIFPPGPERLRALGIFGGIGGFAGASGALIGGLLAEIAWQLAFLLNVPILAVVLVMAARLVPDTSSPGSGTLDWLGAALATSGLTLLLVGVLRGSVQGWTASITLLQFAVAAAALIGFVTRQLVAADPLIPRVLFRHGNVVRGNAINIVGGALLFGIFFILSLHLQMVRHASPLRAGLLIAPVSLSLLAGSLVSHRLMRSLRPPAVLAVGLAFQTVGLAVLALRIADLDAPTGFLVGASMVWGWGTGLVVVSAFVVCTYGLHGPIMGAASGLVSTTLQVGGALGIAILGAVAVSGSGSDFLARSSAGHRSAVIAAMAIGLIGLAVALSATRRWSIDAESVSHAESDQTPAVQA